MTASRRVLVSKAYEDPCLEMVMDAVRVRVPAGPKEFYLIVAFTVMTDVPEAVGP